RCPPGRGPAPSPAHRHGPDPHRRKARLCRDLRAVAQLFSLVRRLAEQAALPNRAAGPTRRPLTRNATRPSGWDFTTKLLPTVRERPSSELVLSRNAAVSALPQMEPGEVVVA